ncbi:MAG: hypothetical protein FJW32_06155 [Acidobacteria bacterium]|nr:hypothetical protein [Acidobacteriota bacterium]
MRGAGARRRIPPIDESQTDPTFKAFVAKLKAAVAARDQKAIRAMSVPDLTIEDRDLPELATILAMGCGRFDKGFTFPYINAKFPEDLEPFECAVAIRPGAVLRAKASVDATVVAPLDYDIVHVAQWNPKSKWQAAKRLDGVRGFVHEDDIRTLGHFHAYCEKRGGAWKLIAFDHGD